MKKISFLSLLVMFFFCYCQAQNYGSKEKKNSESVTYDPQLGEPIDYMPMKIGEILIYEITLKKGTEPLGYREIVWQSLLYQTRIQYKGKLQVSDNNKFYLRLKIKGTASNQGPLSYPIGVELEVLSDELNIYKDVKKVFWAASKRGEFMWFETTTYPGNKSPNKGPWGTWAAEDGYSMRLVFFGNRPGIQIGLGENATDNLLFKGIANVPGTEDKALFFVRTVNPSNSPEDGILASGFQENLYFQKGRGLVFLEQIVNSKLTMTWKRKN